MNIVYINYNASYARPSVAVTQGDTVIAEVMQDPDYQMHNAVKDVIVVRA